MKYSLLNTAGLILVAMFAFAAAPVAAVTTASGPYYATPSWDQRLPASTRFVVLSNWIDAAHPSGGAAVLDRETGLVWEQMPDAFTRTWVNAQSACNNNNVGGRGGWKLPSIQELRSLVDPAAASPTLPAGHPFTNVQLSPYWSASAFAPNAANAWGVSFFFFGIAFDLDKSAPHNVWCVRGGPGGDAQ